MASEPSRIDIYGGVGGNGGEGGREGGGGGAGQGPTTSFGGIQFVIDRLTMDGGPAGWLRAEGTSPASGMEVRRTPHASHPMSFGSSSSPPPTVYLESRNYCDQLLYQGRGFPLYIPKPDGSLPAEYRREGVAIGDVGTVTTDGSFDFFFNIYLPADHPINARIPEGFAPLPPYDDIDVFRDDFNPGNYVSSPSICETNDDFTESTPGGTFIFACDGSNGAVLALPHGAHLQKLRNVAEMRQYATRHAERWYKHVNEARGRGLVNGSLYLVTGCEKAKSWGMASFYGVSRPEFQVSFRPKHGDTGRYRWKAPNCRHKRADLPLVDGTPPNQTTFIHALAISLSETIWGSLFGQVEISQLVGDSTFLGKPGGGFIPYGRQGSSFIWSLSGGSHGTTGGGKQCNTPTHENVILSDASPIPRVFHPSQIIHERIFREVPQAKVVITHDDDWCDIFKEGRKVGQNLSELQQAIFDRSEIIEEDGAVFLRCKFETIESENEAIALSDMDVVASRHSQEQQSVLQQSDEHVSKYHQPQLQTDGGSEYLPQVHEHVYQPMEVDPTESAVEFALARSEVPNATLPTPAIGATAASSPVTQDTADTDLGDGKDPGSPNLSKSSRTMSRSPSVSTSTPTSTSPRGSAKSSPSGETKEAGGKGGGAKAKKQMVPVGYGSGPVDPNAVFVPPGGRWKNVDCIIEAKLYLGNLVAARSTRSLTERRITHVLSVCNDRIPAELPQSGITHMRIPIEDVDYADLLIHLPSACQFIDRAIRSGGAILVHDVQGISRSAAVVAAYLMWSHQLTPTKALETIRRARDQVWPNAGFQEQLMLFEQCQYRPSPSNDIYQSWRYKINRQLQAAGFNLNTSDQTFAP